MLRRPPRWLLAALLVAALWTLAIWVVAARQAPESPSPRGVPELAAGGGDWTVVVGSGRVLQGRMALTRLSDEGEALVVWRPPPFAAPERPVLAISVQSLPFNYVLMLAWRRVGEPAAAYTRLQVPTGRTQTYLLSRHDQWRGTIDEVALYLYPRAGPALVVDEEPITIARFALRGDSLGARVAALTTGWFAADPWNLQSINTLGRYPDLLEGVRLTPMVFALFALGVLVCGLVLWPGPGGWLRLGSGWLIAAVLVIHGHWLAGLAAQRQATARAAALGRELAPAFDRELEQLVDRARERLPPPPAARVFVAADARVFALRAAWHLLPHNVASVVPKPPRTGPAGIGAGDYLLVYRRPELVAEARTGRLRMPGGNWRVALRFEGAGGGLIEFLEADR